MMSLSTILNFSRLLSGCTSSFLGPFLRFPISFVFLFLSSFAIQRCEIDQRGPPKLAQPAVKENMWYGCVRDSAFCQLVRFATRRRMFKFLDERNPEIWTSLLMRRRPDMLRITVRLGRMAVSRIWRVLGGIGGVRTREGGETELLPAERAEHARIYCNGSASSSSTRVAEEGARYSRASGAKIDPEKRKRYSSS
jgi:hypothetical protein